MKLPLRKHCWSNDLIQYYNATNDVQNVQNPIKVIRVEGLDPALQSGSMGEFAWDRY